MVVRHLPLEVGVAFVAYPGQFVQAFLHQHRRRGKAVVCHHSLLGREGAGVAGLHRGQFLVQFLIDGKGFERKVFQVDLLSGGHQLGVILVVDAQEFTAFFSNLVA